MTVELLTEHHLAFKGGCTGSHESTLVKMPYCWKSHGVAYLKKMVNLLVQLGKLVQRCGNVDIVTKGNTLEHNCYRSKRGLEQE